MSGLPKKIFITGVTHGIGKATAEYFCQKGWLVYGISSLNDGRGNEMKQKLSGFNYEVIDVCDEEKIASFLQKIGPIDAAFNNAGIGIKPQELEKADIKQAERVIKVNLIGTLICMKHEMRHMTQGCIVNNASISALKANTGADISYATSKAGVLRLTAEAAANPKYQEKISFFSLVAGYVKTRMTAADDENTIKAKLPAGKMSEPKDIAALIYQIMSNHWVYCSGQCFNYDQGAFLI